MKVVSFDVCICRCLQNTDNQYLEKVCKLKIYLTSHNYSIVRTEWHSEVIKWPLISCTVNYNLSVAERKYFGGFSIPFMWLLGGVFLTYRLWDKKHVLLRNFFKEEKQLKMCLISWLKVHLSLGFDCYSDFLSLALKDSGVL